LENSKISNRKCKRSYEEAKQQEKTKLLGVEARRQYVAEGKEYPI